MRPLSLLLIYLCLFSTSVFGMAVSEFDWVPSGSIDVGILDSENDSNYRSTGEIINSRSPYADGTIPTSKVGRRTTEEVFTIDISRPRWGPVLNSLVIRRRVNTAAAPVELTITIDGMECAKWLRQRFEGNRRFADVMFVIPLEILMKDPKDARTLKPQISMAISADQPYESYHYDFFVTRDWNLMPKEYLGPVVPRPGENAESLYINGLVKEGDHLWPEAMEIYRRAAGKCTSFELARCIRRRIRRCEYFLSATKVRDTREENHFGEHYALGQYCAANGFWNEAYAEYTKAVEANAVHPDATYNLAEAMEYCRMPVEKFAPVMERAGSLYNRKDTNEVSVLCAINTYEIWTRPTGRTRRELTKASMDGLYRDWHYVEQMVYGVSRGAWRMNTTYRLFTEDDSPWVVHHGWMWGPSESDIPQRGTYDHLMCFAEYNSSHACGMDCGPAWSGCTQIGPRRKWEVMLHEWNHQFHWMCMASEEGPGYPATHDCSSCGKQPIVSMGCGHRSSMRYYLNPAQYRRLEPSDPDIPQTHIRTWAVLGPLDGPVLKGKTGEEVLDELKTKGFANNNEIEQIKTVAEKNNEDLAEAARTWFYNSGRMDLVKAAETESTFSPAVHDKNIWRIITDEDGGRIDLNAIFPKAAPKAYAYAHTYIWSPKEQEVRVWYGYHGGLRVWHNQRMVRKGRWYTVNNFRQDPEWVDMLCGHLHLKEGWNSLLCKIERCAPAANDPWGFSVNLVTYDNKPVQGLKYQAAVPDAPVNIDKPLPVGKYYRWEDVKDDYLELLPNLSEEDFRKITGIPELTLAEDIFLMAVPKKATFRGANVITLEDLTRGIG